MAKETVWSRSLMFAGKTVDRVNVRTSVEMLHLCSPVTTRQEPVELEFFFTDGTKVTIDIDSGLGMVHDRQPFLNAY
jgi:hypothetical protein